MGKFNVHKTLEHALRQGMTDKAMTQGQLAKLSGVAQPNISAILNRGKPASEATWQKLLDVVWPD